MDKPFGWRFYSRKVIICDRYDVSITLAILHLLQMARTQKNKATMGHLGLLKAKLAKLRRELITPKGGGGGTGEGFDVAKTGDARIGFVGRRKVFLCAHYGVEIVRIGWRARCRASIRVDCCFKVKTAISPQYLLDRRLWHGQFTVALSAYKITGPRSVVEEAVDSRVS